ncbi:MAG: PAS domain S-box protein [Thermoleophilia bacterium]|nr:PAS domain S-box protein [Thermoleophilia bacterium]
MARRPLIGVSVSDQHTHQQLLRQVAAWGYEVVSLLSSQPEAPKPPPDFGSLDLVILDGLAARHWGQDIVRRKQNDPAFFPIILILSPSESPAPWLDAGFDHWLTMPLDERVLSSLIRRLLSQRHQTQHLVNLSEIRYRAVFEATGTATIVVEEDGTICMANRHCGRVTGYSPQELVGTNWTRYVAPESLQTMVRYHFARREGDPTVPSQYETRLINKDGQVRDVMLHVGLIPHTHQSVVSMVDITAERETIRALQAREAFFSSLFNSHGAPMLLIDPETDAIVDANTAACKFYGWSREELRQLRITDINIARADVIRQARADVLSGASSRFEFVHRRADGSTVPVEVFSAAVQAEGKTLIHAVIHDASARKRAEEEKAKLQERLAEAQKMEAVGRLAGGVAHDFNNALTAIIGYTDLILSDAVHCPPEIRGDIEEIRLAAERAAALTRQLLVYSRHHPVQTELVCVNEMLTELVPLLARTLGETIRLAVDTCQQPSTVRVSKPQFQQAVINLALNARDAMPTGGSLTLRTFRVELTEDYCRSRPPLKPGPYVVLTVADTGVGIEPDVLPHIFEPFFTTKPPGQGTGLGLSTVYGLINQCGGWVEVTSEVGKGTTFELYFPYSPADE